jgi:threonine dehydrogenase-like Zn-dependent dehydrogenase
LTLAARLTGPGAIAVGPLRLPPPAADEVTIAVSHCAVCPTDLVGWRKGRPTGLAGISGHEVSGTVVEVGSAASGVEVGDRVCVDPALARGCGACAACRGGDAFFCSAQRSLPAWGFAERMNLRAAGAVPLPDALPSELAVLAEPLACAVHALPGAGSGTDGGRPLSETDVAVVGAGPIGLLALCRSLELGSEGVRVAARHPEQAESVEALGGLPIAEDLADLRRRPARLLIVAAGAGAEVLEGALDCLAPGGEVLLLAILPERQSVDARKMLLGGLGVRSSIGYGGAGEESDVATATRILARAPDRFERLLGARFDLDLVDAAFAHADAERGRRVVVSCVDGGGHD